MKFDKEHDLLIVPDVHGRTFWREPVMKEDYAHVIFLGDYVDPYPHEYIDQEEAMTQFCDIITFAKEPLVLGQVKPITSVIFTAK